MRIDRRDHASTAATARAPGPEVAKQRREAAPKPVDAFEGAPRAQFRQLAPNGRYNAPYVVSELRDVQAALRTTPAAVEVPDAAGTLDRAFPFVEDLEGRNDVVGEALVVNATFDGHRITIAAPPTMRGESFRNVIDALALMPPEAMREISAVHLSPLPDSVAPHALAAAGDNGIVHVFPVHEALSARAIAVSLVHEAGHIWSQGDWGIRGTEANWAPWTAARNADARRISDYPEGDGREIRPDIRDDLAEAVALYLSTRGTPQHERYRALFPNRFAMLDQRYAQ